MTVYSRTPTLEVYVNGSGTPLANVLSARCSFGFDQRISQAEVRVPGPIEGTGIDFWSTIEIRMAAVGAALTKFWGYVYDFNYALWPREVTLICRGPLIKAELTVAPDDTADPDTPGVDMVNGGAGATDQAQVTDILTRCGLASRISFIGGTGILLGTQTDQEAKGAKAGFVWRRGTSALSYIEELDGICLGFRTVETMGGMIRRRLISPRPSTAAAAITFTEGVDILSASANHSTKEARNRWVVTPYDDGSGREPVVVTGGHPHPVPGVPYISEHLQSGKIEKALESDPGDGLSAERVARWRYDDTNHVLLTTEHQTPRDDVINPGDTIGIYAPVRLEVAQNQWVQHVDLEIDQRGAFTQTLRTKAPAAIGRGGAFLPGTLGALGTLGLGGP